MIQMKLTLQPEFKGQRIEKIAVRGNNSYEEIFKEKLMYIKSYYYFLLYMVRKTD